MRTTQLPGHLHGFHPELLRSNTQICLNMLKPSYMPFVPKLEPPPPIPLGQLSVYDYYPLPVRKAILKQKRAESPSKSLGPKWSRLNAQDEGNNEPEVPDLDDLMVFYPELDEVCDIVVRQRPPEAAQIGLSSAHRIVVSPPLDVLPPISIHYDSFAQKVDDLLAKGFL